MIKTTTTNLLLLLIILTGVTKLNAQEKQKSLTEMDKGSNVWNAGTGFRYLIARALGLKMGIDVARGPEQWAFYVVVGTSWLK